MFDEIIFDANTKGDNLRSIIRNSCPILRLNFPSIGFDLGGKTLVAGFGTTDIIK